MLVCNLQEKKRCVYFRLKSVGYFVSGIIGSTLKSESAIDQD